MPKKDKETNKYNLSRYIPASIAREVRQKCGFGCVVCGNGIYQYEHLDPPFSEAHSHDVNGIILLCGACHDRKTRKFLSTATVAAAALNPKAFQVEHALSSVDVGNFYPQIILGKIEATGVETLIEMFGEKLITISEPEMPGFPFRISAKFYDKNQNLILEIKENQCLMPSKNWDVEMTGGRIFIRRKNGKISLILRIDSPEKIVVERIEMHYKEYLIKCRESSDTIIEKSGLNYIIFKENAYIQNCGIALRMSENGLEIGTNNGFNDSSGKLFVENMQLNGNTYINCTWENNAGANIRIVDR